MHPLNVGSQFHQLPMFMSAREIRSQYQALDGDRRSSGILGYELHTEDDDDLFERKYLHTEDDDDLFDRKYEEALTKKHFNGDYLADHIAKHGIENPVSLQADPWKTGSLGKPAILGGHHRIAVMETERPDELMPVEHYHSVADARRSKKVRF